MVFLAGVRPDLFRSFSNVGFEKWFPPDHIFLEKEDDDTDSATLKAVRYAYTLLGDDANTCEHCASIEDNDPRKASLYYLI
jgi:SulP family sulfate permease